MSKVCVVGLGYIGLPTACLLATHGYQVLGVDTNKNVVEKVNHSEASFKEPGLDELLKEARQRNTLVANANRELAEMAEVLYSSFVKDTSALIERKARYHSYV